MDNEKAVVQGFAIIAIHSVDFAPRPNSDLYTNLCAFIMKTGSSTKSEKENL